MEKLHILNPAPRAWPDKVYLTEKGQLSRHIFRVQSTQAIFQGFASETVKPQEHRSEGTDDPTNKLCREEQVGYCVADCPAMSFVFVC